MKKKITRKQAEAELELAFGAIDNNGYLHGFTLHALCSAMPFTLWLRWCVYWDKINTLKSLSIRSYLDPESDDFEVGFLRLLTAHIFIRDTYKD